MSNKKNKNIWFLLTKLDSQSLTTFLIAFALIAYSIIGKENYNEIPTRRVKGVLKDKPYIEKTGGDFTYYSLIIYINGYDDKFAVRGCAFEALDKNYIKLLEKGQEIVLVIKVNKIKESHPYKVLGMEYKNVKLIDEKHSFSCYNNSWIKNSILLVISLIIISLDIFRIYKKL